MEDINDDEKERGLLEGLLQDRVNREIYLELQNGKLITDSEAYHFFQEVLFKPLIVMAGYDWKWFDKFKYIKNFLAQFHPEYQKYIVSKVTIIAHDKLNIEEDNLRLILESLEGINFEENTNWSPKIDTPEIISTNAGKLLKSHLQVAGLLASEDEIVEKFIEDNREKIIRKITPNRRVESDKDLLSTITSYIRNYVKHDMENDGGYRYLWKGEKPVSEPNAQPFLKILWAQLRFVPLG